jgi:hypothetical protein
MVEDRDTGWMTVLEKKGLHQAADILENYGIDSETDVSVRDQDDFSKLVSRGFKNLDVKKLENCCDTVCTCMKLPLYEIALWLDVDSLLRHGFRNRLKFYLLQSNRHGFRNRLKCHVLVSYYSP